MPRTLSAAARRAIFAQQTGEAFILLLELSHPSLVDPIRVCANSADVTSGGLLYSRFPFEVTMPSETEDAPPTVQLRIANADRQIVQAVRELSGAAMTVTLSIVLASSPDIIEAGPFVFALRNVTYDAAWVEGTLMFEDVLNEPYPAAMFTPARFPGMF